MTMAEMVTEDPRLVPDVIPDREERRRDELAYVRRYADDLQAKDYEVVQHEIEQGDDGIAGSDFDTMFFQPGILEHPVTLQHVVHRPATDAGGDLGPP